MNNQFSKLMLSLIGMMLIISVTCCTLLSLYISIAEYKYTKIFIICATAGFNLWLLAGICSNILKYIIEKVTINIEGDQKKIKSDIIKVIFGDSNIINVTMLKDAVLNFNIAFYPIELQKLMDNGYDEVNIILTRKKITLKLLLRDRESTIIEKKINYKQYLSIKKQIER
jgi:hypothetical protein